MVIFSSLRPSFRCTLRNERASDDRAPSCTCEGCDRACNNSALKKEADPRTMNHMSNLSNAMRLRRRPPSGWPPLSAGWAACSFAAVLGILAFELGTRF
jgi:hypothetical protein